MFQQVILGNLAKERVSLVGVTGQAGAGKTTHITPLIGTIVRDVGFNFACLSLDTFFILSSADRKTWLEEGVKISCEEGLRRANQMTWWNFAKAQEAINLLLSGRELHLEGVYNRADKGELTGEVHIAPSREGMLIAFEGVGVCHLNGMAELFFTYAPAEVRLERLRQRDKHRQGQEVFERFRVTQSFERNYFPLYWDRITRFIDNSVDYPQILPLMAADYALSEEGLSIE